MDPMSRRHFLNRAVIGTGAVGAWLAGAERLQASPLGLPIGSQVYPLRSMLGDFPAFVTKIAAIGVSRLEALLAHRLRPRLRIAGGR